MTIELNHTIVHAHDKRASAAFLADILGIDVQPQWGPFVPVAVGATSLDYVDDGGDIAPQHYAFLMSDAEFDAGLARLHDRGIAIWADPHQQEPGLINHHYGGRGVYFQDPDGHLMELMTVPYGSNPQ